MSEFVIPIEVTAAEWKIILNILHSIIPDRVVWAFGSRARFAAKPYSDLDLAILGDQALSLAEMADLNEAFSSSDLPFKVDAVDFSSASEAFREIIRSHPVGIQMA